MIFRILTVTLAAIAFLSTNASAADKYVFDKTHTSIIWFASHMGFSDSTGQFMDFDGEIKLDQEKPSNSSINITIHMDSIRTGLPKFDKHLKTADFFNIEKFTTAYFVSTSVKKTGDNTAKVHGDLTLAGVTNPLTLDVTMNKVGTNPFNNKETAGFSATTTIRRSIFGINYGLPGIGDDVKVVIEAEALKKVKKGKH